MAFLHMAALLSLSVIPSAARQQAASPIDLQRAHQYFLEAKCLSDDDGGKLWGRPLYGPMLFADPETHTVVANQPDAEGRLQKQGDVYVGVLPPEVSPSNTAMNWAGVKWTMVVWQYLGNRAVPRGRLMLHELFHRIQDDLGLPGSNAVSNHLDTLEGRYWLQLEWRALIEALQAEGAARKTAIADAILFRAYRRVLLPGAAVREHTLEMNEGLAEYTGVSLCGETPVGARDYMIHNLRGAPHLPTFVRSFAYYTGPAYGLLLDETQPAWRTGLKQSEELSELLGKAAGLTLPSDLRRSASERAQAYDGRALRAAEEKHDNERRKQEAAYRKLLIEGPVLELALQHFDYAFDPNNVVPMEGVGTVYPTLRLTDDWGVLEVRQGALMASDFKKAFVSAPLNPAGATVQGPGWTLTLKSGWKLAPGPRKGDYRLAQEGATQG